MRVIGAFSQSKTNNAIYFCDCSLEELEGKGLPKSTLNMVLEKADASKGIMLAISSNDELNKNKKCVGLMFTDTGGYYVTATSKAIDYLLDDMKQIYEWEYGDDTAGN